ncbi:MAG: SDR family oxidoreductase [Sphingobium sp.]
MAVVAITGGNRGIGLELAKLYRAAGFAVIVGVRDPGAATALPDDVEILPLDVGDDGSVAAFAEALADRSLDILINNAGIIGPRKQSSLVMDFTGFLDTLNVNTLGPLRVTQALLPNLLRAPAGKVAIVSSRMGSMSYAQSNNLAYRASKAAVNKVSQGLATDLSDKGIAVAALHPGWVRTDMGGRGADISPEESAAGIKAVLDGLSIGDSGKFWDYDGGIVPW